MENGIGKKEVLIFLTPYLKKYSKQIIAVFFFSILFALTQAIPAKITQLIIDDGFIKKQYSLIVKYAIFLLLLQFSKSIFSYLLNKKGVFLGQNIVSNIRTSVYKKLFALPLDFFSNNESSYVNSRIREVNNISELFSPSVFSQLASIFDFIFISVILINISWEMFLLLLLPIPFLFIVVKKGMAKLIKTSEDLLESNSKQISLVNERISGLEFIQTTGKENEEYSKMKSTDEQLVDKTIQQSITMRGLTEIFGLFLTFAPIILYILGGKLFMNNLITLGGILTFSAYMNRVYSPFINYASLSMIIEPAFLSLKRVIEMFFNDINNWNDENKKHLTKEITNLNITNLNFSYDKRTSLLENINIVVKNGEILQIKGGNGSGKTTLTKLILGLLQPDEGTIMYNMIPINELSLTHVRKKIAVVNQKIFLFNDTVKNNILYSAKDNDQENFEKIIERLNIQQIYHNHNSDEDMLVGENGVKLSGGEIQKIALARSLLNDADIFIFDEASSNIDIETKKTLKNIIKNDLNGKIVIIIDHSSFFDDISMKTIYLKSD